MLSLPWQGGADNLAADPFSLVLFSWDEDASKQLECAPRPSCAGGERRHHATTRRRRHAALCPGHRYPQEPQPADGRGHGGDHHGGGGRHAGG